MLSKRVLFLSRSPKCYSTSASYKYLELSQANKVLTVNMNRPDLSNAFNEDLIAEMIDVFSKVDPEFRAVVLTGNGKQFSAGTLSRDQ